MLGFQTSTAPQASYLAPRARLAMRSAWFSLCLLPFSFMGAMVLGDWLLTIQGYQSGTEDIEVGAVLKAGVPAVLVLVAPTVLAAWFGFRAKRLGHPGWRVPVLAAGVIAAAFIGLNMLQVLAALVANL